MENMNEGETISRMLELCCLNLGTFNPRAGGHLRRRSGLLQTPRSYYAELRDCPRFPLGQAQAMREVGAILRVRSSPRDSGRLQLQLALDAASRYIVKWVEAAAVTLEDGGNTLAPVAEMLSSCCRYMEALATHCPASFFANCSSLVKPVVKVLMVSSRIDRGQDPAKQGCRVSAIEEERECAGLADETPSTDGMAKEDGIGLGSAELSLNSVKMLEPWVELLGLCLLPSCTGLRRPQDGNEPDGSPESDVDETDSEGEEEGDEDGSNTSFPGQRSRLGLMSSWMQSPGIPRDRMDTWGYLLNQRDGGTDANADAPYHLTVLVSRLVKAAASASRPASVSLLATTLVTLCACTPEGGTCGLDGANTGGHVFDEAFTCLQGVAATTPTGSAQTECVKAGLVALKECAEVAQLSALMKHVSTGLETLQGVTGRLKLQLRSTAVKKPQDYSNTLSFCRDARVAAIACARTLVRRAGAEYVVADPQRFLGEFVEAMASPFLLGDAVAALREAAAPPSSSEAENGAGDNSNSLGGGEGRGGDLVMALRDMVLPGAVERLAKALGNIRRYTAATGSEVLKAAVWLAQAASDELRPFRARLGMALVESATSLEASENSKDMDERLRLCLRGIRRIVRPAARCPGSVSGTANSGTGMVDGDGGSGKSARPSLEAEAQHPSAEDKSFALGAFNLACSVMEREWLGQAEMGDSSSHSGSDEEEDKDDDEPAAAPPACESTLANVDASISTILDAHRTLEVLIRSGAFTIVINDSGAHPDSIERLVALLQAVVLRIGQVGKGTGSSQPMVTDDDVMTLCHGAEVLEAAADSADQACREHAKAFRIVEDLTEIVASLRMACDERSGMHPAVLDACSWTRKR